MGGGRGAPQVSFFCRTQHVKVTVDVACSTAGVKHITHAQLSGFCLHTPKQIKGYCYAEPCLQFDKACKLSSRHLPRCGFDPKA